MAVIRADAPTNNVISFSGKVAEQFPPAVPKFNSSGTRNTAEIVNFSNGLTATQSPTLHLPREEQGQPVPCVRKTAQPRDEQHSIKAIAALVPTLSDKELKRRFPKAWSEHRTLKSKTKRKSSPDTLHPNFATFRGFLAAMGPAPSTRHSIDRIDLTNPVYGPSECRWATAKAQARNRSTNVHIAWAGEHHSLAEWAELSGAKYETLKKRHQRGWSAERIFADAPKKKYRTPSNVVHPGATPSPSQHTVAEHAVREVPSFNGDGWPVTLKSPRDFETGWQHARAQAIKTGSPPLSKAYFGAWVVGSHVNHLRKKLISAGFAELIGSGRDRLRPERLSELEKLASEEGIDVPDYYRVAMINDAFLGAYLDHSERCAVHSRYARCPRRARESAYQLLMHEIRKRPQFNPLNVWKVYL